MKKDSAIGVLMFPAGGKNGPCHGWRVASLDVTLYLYVTTVARTEFTLTLMFSMFQAAESQGVVISRSLGPLFTNVQAVLSYNGPILFLAYFLFSLSLSVCGAK